ncbi:MAG: hypothetical protein ABW318_09105, partial [Vicinamibacterales bacterium]
MTHLLGVLLVALSVPVWAQSLVEIAKVEEARRQAVKSPARVYTNRDLKPEPREHRPAVLVAPGTEPDVSEAPSKETDEAHGKALIKTARTALERSRV